MEALWLGSILTETKREKSFIVIDVFYGDRRRTLLLILNIVTLKYCVFNIERVRCRGTELPACLCVVCIFLRFTRNPDQSQNTLD